MSTMQTLLAPVLPSGITIPDELERAWTWMEQQGWGRTNRNGYFLTPYAGDRQLGIVFSPDETLAGWFEPDTPGRRQLAAFAEIAGDGATAVIWRDDTGALRFGGLGSDGDIYLLADSAVDFLRLIAVGYHEIVPSSLGDVPDLAESVAAVADFRDWVETTFQVRVPDRWPYAEAGDPFAAWVEAKLA